MTDDNIRSYPVVPGVNIPLEMIPPEARDAAMGRYMDAFSRLEGIIHLSIGLIMQTDLMALGSVFASLGTRQSIDLFEAVGQEHLSKKGSERVTAIHEKLVRRNQRRNSIVHGGWNLTVLITDKVVTQEWVRTYPHVSPAIRNLPYTDPKVAGTYSFTIQELDKTTGHVEEMLQEFSALIEDLPSLRPPPPPAEG